MSFRLGLVGLCTSHPANWVPIIRSLVEQEYVDIEIVAAWDAGETRPEGYAAQFCRQHDIPECPGRIEDLVDLVDGVIVHTANWDRHIEQTRPFVEADKSVFIDKPIVGNLQDVNQLLDWEREGGRITGGSSLRFAGPVVQFLTQPVEERGEVHTAYTATGVDDFNYGIHAYALMSCLMGPGVRSAQYLGSSRQKLIKLEWQDGRIGLVTVGRSPWIPFKITAVTDKSLECIDAGPGQELYTAMLSATLPYLTEQENEAPLPLEELLEPELAALAARLSWLNHGQLMFLTDLRQDDPGYDGTQFAIEYRRGRMGS